MVVKFTDDELKVLKIRKRPYSTFGPITISKNPLDEMNKDRFSISAYWVDITCGDYSADVSCTLSGKKGSGKSYSSLELARMCAIRTSIKLNNDDGAAWKDYFDVERSVAVMDSDKLIEILTRKDKYQIIIADDSGVINGAREYRSSKNKLLNNVFVVNRTLHNIMLSSMPETRHLDRQARDLPEYQMDFHKNEALMSMGLAQAKFFVRVTDPKTSENYFRFPHWRDEKVVSVMIPLPPKDMRDEYDHLREIGRNKIQDALSEALNNAEPEQAPGENRKDIQQQQINTAQSMMDSMQYSAQSNTAKFKKIADHTGLSVYTIRSWYAQGKIC